MKNPMLTIAAAALAAFACHAQTVTASRGYVDRRTSLTAVTNNGQVVGYKVGLHTNDSEAVASLAHVDAAVAAASPANYDAVSTAALHALGVTTVDSPEWFEWNAWQSPVAVTNTLFLPVDTGLIMGEANSAYYDTLRNAAWTGYRDGDSAILGFNEGPAGYSAYSPRMWVVDFCADAVRLINGSESSAGPLAAIFQYGSDDNKSARQEMEDYVTNQLADVRAALAASEVAASAMRTKTDLTAYMATSFSDWKVVKFAQNGVYELSDNPLIFQSNNGPDAPASWWIQLVQGEFDTYNRDGDATHLAGVISDGTNTIEYEFVRTATYSSDGGLLATNATGQLQISRTLEILPDPSPSADSEGLTLDDGAAVVIGGAGDRSPASLTVGRVSPLFHGAEVIVNGASGRKIVIGGGFDGNAAQQIAVDGTNILPLVFGAASKEAVSAASNVLATTKVDTSYGSASRLSVAGLTVTRPPLGGGEQLLQTYIQGGQSTANPWMTFKSTDGTTSGSLGYGGGVDEARLWWADGSSKDGKWLAFYDEVVASTNAVVASQKAYVDTVSNNLQTAITSLRSDVENGYVNANDFENALDGKRDKDDLSYGGTHGDSWYVTGSLTAELTNTVGVAGQYECTVDGRRWVLYVGNTTAAFGVVGEGAHDRIDYADNGWSAAPTSLQFDLDGNDYWVTKGGRIALTSDIEPATNLIWQTFTHAAAILKETDDELVRRITEKADYGDLTAPGDAWTISGIAYGTLESTGAANTFTATIDGSYYHLVWNGSSWMLSANTSPNIMGQTLEGNIESVVLSGHTVLGDVQLKRTGGRIALQSDVAASTNAVVEALASYVRTETVTNVVRTVVSRTSDYIWDDDDECLYRREMKGGYLYYTPVTNVNALLPENSAILNYLEENR